MGNLTVKESGEMVNIISPNVNNITSFKVHFSPKQEGTGDPSPENVREIIGWNGVEGYISNVAQPYSSTSNTLTAMIDWTNDVGTIYGGYVDLISGELVSSWICSKIKDLDGTWSYRSNNKRFQITLQSNFANTDSTTWSRFAIAEAYKKSTVDGYANEQIATYINKHIYIRDDSFDGDVEAFLGAVGDTKVAYELAEPITHQLTPQQLSTFKGQNNFWSNADYVEIEYELTETFDIQKAKRKIILNQPHVESASGDLVTFDTDMKGKLKECKVYFSPVQEGEGDPSPENVRNITGWNGVNITQECVENITNEYSIDWTDSVGTVYGGYVDLVSGEIYKSFEQIIFDGNTKFNDINKYDDSTRFIYSKKRLTLPTKNGGICYFNYYTNKKSASLINNGFIGSTGNILIYTDTSINSIDLLTEYQTNNPLQLVYELETPVYIATLTPQQLLTFKGTNNIYSNTNGQTEIKYWKH